MNCHFGLFWKQRLNWWQVRVSGLGIKGASTNFSVFPCKDGSWFTTLCQTFNIFNAQYGENFQEVWWYLVICTWPPSCQGALYETWSCHHDHVTVLAWAWECLEKTVSPSSLLLSIVSWNCIPGGESYMPTLFRPATEFPGYKLISDEEKHGGHMFCG